MNIKSQRKIAQSILKAGQNRIWIDPEKTSEINEAITKDDIRKQIASGAIVKKPVVGTSRVRARVIAEQKKKGRMSGHGKRHGTANARTSSKRTWIEKIRSLRSELKKLRENEKITPSEYRQLYRKSSAGVFKDKSYLHLHIKKMKE